MLYQKEKRSRIFQIKTLSKDRKTTVPSFMFIFNPLLSDGTSKSRCSVGKIIPIQAAV